MSSVAGLVCSQLHQVQREILKNEHHIIQQLKWETQGFIVGFQAIYNEFYPMPEKWGSVAEKCSGIESREPQHWSDKNRLIWTYELNPNSVNMENLCDSDI